MAHPLPNQALDGLLNWLSGNSYEFVCPTPDTYSRVVARDPGRLAADLAEVFGWNRPFAPNLIPHPLLEGLLAAGLVFEEGNGLFRAGLRVSSLGMDLLAHSPFPTTQKDAVFFGPDSYRFARAIHTALAGACFGRAIEVGCGTGCGAIAAARAARINEMLATDINERALDCARANLAAAGVPARAFQSDLFLEVDGRFDLILANPPFMADADGRWYRDGGGPLGIGLAQRIVREAPGKLNPGGTLLLYTGSPVVRSGHLLLNELETLKSLDYAFEEVDPDIFGEELSHPAYAEVERIAAVVLTFRMPA